MKMKITIDQKTYEVDVEVLDGDAPAPEPMPGSAVVPAAPPPIASGPPDADEKSVRSPIAGVVVKIPAQEGQQIQPNDTLIILEAMKMETAIASSLGGKVKKILVSPGDAVQSGQVVVEFE